MGPARTLPAVALPGTQRQISAWLSIAQRAKARQGRIVTTYMTAEEIDQALDILEAFRAGETISDIARRMEMRSDRVRRALKRFSQPVWKEETPETETEVSRCRACEIILNEAWCTWNEDSLCDDCQISLAIIVELTGLDPDTALTLWTQPITDVISPLERFLAARNEEVSAV